MSLITAHMFNNSEESIESDVQTSDWHNQHMLNQLELNNAHGFKNKDSVIIRGHVLQVITKGSGRRRFTFKCEATGGIYLCLFPYAHRQAKHVHKGTYLSIVGEFLEAGSMGNVRTRNNNSAPIYKIPIRDTISVKSFGLDFFKNIPDPERNANRPAKSKKIV